MSERLYAVKLGDKWFAFDVNVLIPQFIAPRCITGFVSLARLVAAKRSGKVVAFAPEDELDAARSRVAELEAEVERRRNRACVCMFCGQSYRFVGDSAPPNLVAEVMAHEAKCEQNPYLARIKDLETAVRIRDEWIKTYCGGNCTRCESRACPLRTNPVEGNS